MCSSIISGLTFGEGYTTTPNLERSAIEKDYVLHLSEYFRQAGSDPNFRRLASRRVASIPKIKKRQNVKQNAGLIYFKKGDMRKDCTTHVDTIKAMGFDGVVLFYPVHFSGGNSKTYKMPKDPVYGKHYRYEVANRPTTDEFEKCLDHISRNGLNLNFAPHLESIKTLVSPDESEWRLQSGIPINREYYQTSFSPLIEYLKKSDNFKDGSLSVTVFSEIDPMVLSAPKASVEVIKNLKIDLRSVKTKRVEIIYNTNGDFYNGWDLPQAARVSSCHYLKKLLTKVDTIAPSIYGDRGHVSHEKNSGHATSRVTIKAFKERMNKKLGELCNRQRYLVRVDDKRIGFGEFALDPKNKKQSYDVFLRDKSANPSFVNYWNHSEWDHHGITRDISGEKFNRELFESD